MVAGRAISWLAAAAPSSDHTMCTLCCCISYDALMWCVEARYTAVVDQPCTHYVSRAASANCAGEHLECSGLGSSGIRGLQTGRWPLQVCSSRRMYSSGRRTVCMWQQYSFLLYVFCASSSKWMSVSRKLWRYESPHGPACFGLPPGLACCWCCSNKGTLHSPWCCLEALVGIR
jgi:hypothetical protein